MKRSVILTDRLGPDILLSVLDERTSIASRARAFESTRLAQLVFNVLLTRKLPTFLPRLN